MKPRDWAKIVPGAFILGWLSILVVASHGCAHAPPTPPGYVSCPAACMNEEKLPCEVSYDLCMRLCDRIVINQPEWANCVSVATTCAEFAACKSAKPVDGVLRAEGLN